MKSQARHNVAAVVFIALAVGGGIIFLDEIFAFIGTPEERCAWAEQQVAEAVGPSAEALWTGYRNGTCVGVSR